VTELSAARPPLIRAMNEQLLLGHIRADGPYSRADLARISGLSKPTVSLALANLERAGLVRAAGQRTGLPGRTALLYEIRPDAGFVLGLDIGNQYLRGAVADLTGTVRARGSRKVAATSVRGRIAELVQLADELCEQAGMTRREITQTVIGTPGIYDPKRNAIALTGGLAGWDKPSALDGLRDAFGPGLALENDVDAAALAEQTHGCGRDVRTFAWVHVGTGIGMGLVLDGRLHRGAHGVAGEIAFMPLGEGGFDPAEARRRGPLEAAAAAAGIVRAARLAGIRGPVSARRVFTAAARGDERAVAIVANEARLVANAICCVITVMDPELVVLGGGIGQAPGFAEVVTEVLRDMAPVLPEVRVTALGSDVVVDGCLAEGASLAWNQLTSDLLFGQTAE
jgi:predicted NBD/HSP70 family sugar kinase